MMELCWRGVQHVADIAGFALAEMECDVVVRGEGEYAIEKILEMLDVKKEGGADVFLD